MSTSPDPTSSTRRSAIAGAAIVLGSLATAGKLRAETQPQPGKATTDPAANRTRTALHQEVAFSATPARIYGALLDAKQFAALTGSAAEIDPKEGGAFLTFGGLIAGRTIELVPGQRIVQAWRPTHWDPGIYSIVRFDLRTQGAFTVVVLDHTGFPEGEYDSLSAGWKSHYWDPMQKFFG